MNVSEVEAALCMWEHAVTPDGLMNIKSKPFLDWLAGEEGYAHARMAVIHLAPFCEISYIWAKHNGYDDCFDWEFVPAWCQYAMKRTPAVISAEWAISIGKSIYEDWMVVNPPTK